MGSRVIASGVVAFAVFVVATSAGEAAVIGYWNFNDGNLIVDQGTGTMTVSGPAPAYGIGTTLNAQPGVTAGAAFAIFDEGPFDIDFAIDTTGFNGVMLSLALRGDPSWLSNPLFPSGIQVTYFYSLDGGASFTGFQATPPADYSTICIGERIDTCLSPRAIGAVASLDNANLVFRITQFPFGLTPGDALLIDNVTVSVPEPPSLALLGGAALMGVLRRRRGTATPS